MHIGTCYCHMHMMHLIRAWLLATQPSRGSGGVVQECWIRVQWIGHQVSKSKNTGKYGAWCIHLLGPLGPLWSRLAEPDAATTSRAARVAAVAFTPGQHVYPPDTESA